MAIHELVDALLLGARNTLNDEWRPAEAGPPKVVTLAAQDADACLKVIEAAWDALRTGRVVGEACDRLDEAFKSLALAAVGSDAADLPEPAPRPPLEVVR